VKRVHIIQIDLDKPHRSLMSPDAKFLMADKGIGRPGISLWAEWRLPGDGPPMIVRTFVAYGDEQSMSEDLVHRASCLDYRGTAWHVYEVIK
jgi:hypothetical protein